MTYAGGKASVTISGGTTLVNALTHGTSQPNYAASFTLKQASQEVQFNFTFTDNLNPTSTIQPGGLTSQGTFTVADAIYDDPSAKPIVPVVSFPMNMDFTIPDFVSMQANPKMTVNTNVAIPPGVAIPTVFLTAKNVVCTPAPNTMNQEDENP